MKLLVLFARGLRFDYLGCYGNAWVQTPTLDALAARGVVFDQHFADSTDTHAAYLDLCRPRSASVLLYDAERPPPQAFRDGWEHVNAIRASAETDALESLVQATQRQLRRLPTNDRWLLWVDLPTALPPWNVPAEFSNAYFRDAPTDDDDPDVEIEPLTPLPDPSPGAIDATDETLLLRLQGSYAAAVSYLDAGVREILSAVGDDVAVVFTSEIGTPLGEHGYVGAALPWPTETLTHLPLLVRLPGAVHAGRRVGAMTQSRELMPKLLQCLGSGSPPPGELLDAPGEAAAVSRSGSGSDTSWALRTAEWSYILPPSVTDFADARLHVRPDDRWELNNVVQQRLDVAERMAQQLAQWRSSAGRPDQIATAE